jgi:mono/diheme cytochrome c family protein
MKLISTLAVLAIAVACLGGCERDRMSERGFSLPEGDPDAGRDTFIYMQCHQCHTVEGETFPALPGLDPPYVELGGPVTRVKSYGELVTAIINPSHKLASGYADDVVAEGGESNMYIYNQYMTIQELVDLVMFLQPYYDVVVPRYDYRVYP